MVRCSPPQSLAGASARTRDCGPTPAYVAGGGARGAEGFSLTTPAGPDTRKAGGCMDTLYRHCAGLDVHKDTVVVCVRHWEAGRFREQPVQTFQTTTRALLSLGDYLTQEQVTHVAMESTGGLLAAGME